MSATGPWDGTAPVRRGRTARRLTTWVLAASFLVFAVGSVLAWSRYDAQRTTAVNEAVSEAADGARITGRIVADRISTLQAIAATPVIRQQEPASMLEYFNRLQREVEGLENGVAFIDAQSRAVVESGFPLTTPPVDVSERRHIRQALATGSPQVSAAFAALRTPGPGRPIVVVVVPTFDPAGRVIGALASPVSLDTPVATLEVLRRLPDIVVLDSQGNVIVRGREPIAGIEQPANADLLERIRQAPSGVQRRGVGLHGAGGRLVAWTAEPESGWTVAVDRSYAAALGEARPILVLSLVALALLGLAGTGLAVVVGRRLDREDRRVAEQAALVTDVATRLAASATVSDIADVVTEGARRAAGAQHAILAIPRSDGFELRPWTPDPDLDPMPDDLAWPGPATARDGRPRYFRRAEEAIAAFPNVRALHDRHGIEASAVVAVPMQGRSGFLAVYCSAEYAFDPGEREVLVSLGVLAGQALERARHLEVARHERDRLALLSDLTRRIAAARAAHEVGEAAIDTAGLLGATSMIVAVREASHLRRVAQRGAPAVPETAGGRAARLPLAQAVLAGQPVFVSDLNDLGASPERDALLADWRLGALRSLALLPLPGQDSPLGLFAVGFDEARTLAVDEQAFLMAVASACGPALERALRHEHEHRIAEELQRGLLPDAIATVEGLTISADYRPASDDLLVGGDWYDALPRADGTVLLAIGDVTGHGQTAAVTMGRLRTLLLANRQLPPGELLMLLDRFATDTGAMATAQLVVVDPVTGAATFANAGHPPAAVVDEAGARLVPVVPGRPLGLASDGFVTEQMTLSPGAVLALYTDGLVERRGEVIDEGLHRILATLDRLVTSVPAGQLASRLSTALDDHTRGDDLAVLVAVASAVPARLELRLPARTASIRRGRLALERWLVARGLSEHQRFDLLLVASEALANAARHAYRGATDGVVDLVVQGDGGQVVVTVRDQGTWLDREEPGDGRGLELMRALSDTEVHRSAHGTTLVLRWPPAGVVGPVDEPEGDRRPATL
jgi:anti-sigma regulatory factor (Ser/Thr protein kinase)/GAF domain-containing protein